MRGNLLILGITLWIPTLSVAQDSDYNLCGQLTLETLYNMERTVEKYEFPWLARVVYTPGINKTCMATLISKIYVIAPALCLNDANYEGLYFGSEPDTSTLDLNCIETRTKECPVRRIDQIIYAIHEDSLFVPNVEALVRLKHIVTTSKAIHPICLPPPHVSKEDFVAQHLLTAGFAEHSRRYTKLFVYIVDDEICRKMYEDANETHLCANTCDNGSKFINGTALMGVQVTQSKPDFYYLIGMMIKGQEDCSDYKPDLFLRINYTWIQETIIEDAVSLTGYHKTIVELIHG